ncbi:MAG: lipoate--protein ligase family protein [Acidimicrobiales bacterium]
MVERHRGSAADLHALDWPDPVVPTVWVLEVDAPALVLGSTQKAETIDTDRLAAAGIALARRRSGGGAVLLEPGGSVWIDVLLPRDDPRWVDDVGHSFTWLGQAWVGALADLGIGGARVHAGALQCGRFGKQVCFAGIGPGEVTVDGVKVVGVSQRRTRDGARFQCVVHRAWTPGPLAAIAGVDPGALPPVAVVDRPAAAVEAAIRTHLA